MARSLATIVTVADLIKEVLKEVPDDIIKARTRGRMVGGTVEEGCDREEEVPNGFVSARTWGKDVCREETRGGMVGGAVEESSKWRTAMLRSKRNRVVGGAVEKGHEGGQLVVKDIVERNKEDLSSENESVGHGRLRED
ncbi:hypothetical protein ONZ45_g4478 [Pleurotus djamor]|nr:hypothetical protein ONZ45_g4478 [Pleurotus djamor]